MGVFEKDIGLKGKKEYIKGTSFNMCNMMSALQMNAYYNFLQKNNISLELVIKWFFEVYLKEEFGAGGFVYNPSKNDASWLDKCRNIASEMDGVLKQYRMYVEDGQIDRELLEMSSEHIVLSMVPSFWRISMHMQKVRIYIIKCIYCSLINQLLHIQRKQKVHIIRSVCLSCQRR